MVSLVHFTDVFFSFSVTMFLLVRCNRSHVNFNKISVILWAFSLSKNVNLGVHVHGSAHLSSFAFLGNTQIKVRA
jgi:hypothetical protein